MRPYLRSFAGGEVTPELFGRVDDIKFQTGLALAQNFITLPHGPARNRPGSEWRAATRDSGNGTARLLPFTFSTTQTHIIEFGATSTPGTGYFRFFTNGVPVLVLDGGVPPAYIVNQTVASINAGTDEITTSGAHGLSTGDTVRMTADPTGVMPTIASPYIAPVFLSQLIPYYAIVTGATTLKLAATLADALANVPINLTSTGTLPLRVQKHYQKGDLVEGTPAGAAGYHYVIQDPTIPGSAQATPGNATYYYFQTTTVYEIPHPYVQTNLFYVEHWQSNDVMTLTHEDHPPRTLRRVGVTNWQLVDETFAPTLSPPSAVNAAATQAGMAVVIAAHLGNSPLRLQANSHVPWVNGDSVYGTVTFATGSFGPGFFRVVQISGTDFDLINTDGTNMSAATFGAFSSGTLRATEMSSEISNSYVVTSIDVEGRESQGSVVATVSNNLFAEGAYNTITWIAATSAVRYKVYKLQNGLYGLIGVVDAPTVSFKDDNIAPDLGSAPPRFDSSLGTAPYPAAGCYHEQRKVFARDQSVWMTRPGTERDLTYSIPVKADDRVAFTIAATEFSQIQHMVSMGGGLIALTSSTEYAILSPDSEIITPTSVMPRAASFIGSNNVKPVLVNNALVFPAARGGHMREMTYQAVAQGFVTGDLSLRATHLFDNLTIVDAAYSRAPYPIVWAVSSNGRLLGLTYVPDQQVSGWHRHTLGGTDAIVESCAVVAEGNEDRLYLVVRRTVNAATVRYIERLAVMAFTTLAESFFVDSGRTFTNVTAGQLGGFLHLRGKTVAILADGIVYPQQVVNSAGEITAPACARLTAGLPIDAQLQTLPLVMQIDGLGQGQRKAVSDVWVRISNSAPFLLGPALNNLVPTDAAAPSIRGLLTAETLVTNRFRVRTPPAISEDGQTFIKHTAPLPLTVSGLTIGVSTGD